MSGGRKAGRGAQRAGGRAERNRDEINHHLLSAHSVPFTVPSAFHLLFHFLPTRVVGNYVSMLQRGKMRCLHEFGFDLVVNEVSLSVAKLGRSLRVTVIGKDWLSHGTPGAGEYYPSAS